MIGMGHRLADNGRLHIGGHGNVEYFDGAVRQQFPDIRMTFGDAVQFGHSVGMSRIARSNGDRIEPGLAIGDEVTIAHDETGADAANANIPALGPTRQVVQR